MSTRQRDVINLQKRGLKWVPDSTRESCVKCFSDFSVFNRRHHCRVCGLLFCANCAKFFSAFPETLEHRDKVRVCSDCNTRGGNPPEELVTDGVKTYTVVGYQECPDHQRVADILAVLVGKYPSLLRGEIVGADSKEEYDAWLEDKCSKSGIRHTTSPICFLGTEDNGEYLGGAEEFVSYLNDRFPYDNIGEKDGGCEIM